MTIPRFNIEGFFCGPRSSSECLLVEIADQFGTQEGELNTPPDFQDDEWLALGEAKTAYGQAGEGALYQKLLKLEARLPKGRQNFIGAKSPEEFYEQCLAYGRNKLGTARIDALTKRLSAYATSLHQPAGLADKGRAVWKEFQSLSQLLAPFKPEAIEKLIGSLFLKGAEPVASDYSIAAYNFYKKVGFARTADFYTRVITAGLNETVVHQGLQDLSKSELDSEQKRELFATVLQSPSRLIQDTAVDQLALMRDPRILGRLYELFNRFDQNFEQRSDTLAAIGKIWSQPLGGQALDAAQHRANIIFVLSAMMYNWGELESQAHALLIEHKDSVTSNILREMFTGFMESKRYHLARDVADLLEELGDAGTAEFIEAVEDKYGFKGFKNTGFQSGLGVGVSIPVSEVDTKVNFYAEAILFEITRAFLKYPSTPPSMVETFMGRASIDLRLGTDHEGIGQVARARFGMLTELTGTDLSLGVNHRGQPYCAVQVNFIDWRRVIVPGIGLGIEAVFPTGRDGAEDPFVLSANLVIRWAWFDPDYWKLDN